MNFSQFCQTFFQLIQKLQVYLVIFFICPLFWKSYLVKKFSFLKILTLYFHRFCQNEVFALKGPYSSVFSSAKECFAPYRQISNKCETHSNLRHSHTSLRCESGGAKHSSYETTQAATKASWRILEVISIERKFNSAASQPKPLSQPHPLASFSVT